MFYKIILVIAAHYNYELKQINVKTVFLHNKLKEVVYIKQFTEYKKKEEKMYRLKKILYELKQSSCLWYEIMHKFLVNNDYTYFHTDNSVFMNSNLIIALYIDNILICKLKKKIINELKAKLSTQFNMMNCDSCKHYLKMWIMHDRTLRMLILLQKIYLKKVLKDFDFLKTKAVTTSMKSDIYYTKTKNIVILQLI